MAESQEPRRPSDPGPRRPPLPRMWKETPDAYPLVEPAGEVLKGKVETGTSKSSKGGAPARKAEPKQEKGEPDPKAKPAPQKIESRRTILREETPHLDTVEARQRVRVVVGAGILVVFGVVGLLLYQAIAPESTEEEPIDFGAAVASGPRGPDRARSEREAGLLLDRAREVAGNGNTTMAVSLLERLGKSYPGTKSAAEAREALDRPGKNLPLFLDRPTVVAAEAEKAAVRAPVAPVVEASPTPTAAVKGAVADLDLPSNTPGPDAAAPDPTKVATPEASRPLPKGFSARQGGAVDPSGWPVEIVGARDGAAMVLVPGAVFVQGRDGSDAAEGPAHQVRLSTFYIDKHEVTVRQFKIFQRESGRRQDRDRALARDPGLADLDADDDRPVVMVSARDASDYAFWAAKRLPTEAQWEAAARTTDGRVFPWGGDAETPKDREIRPVMTFRKDLSPYGAFDLGGNAWEWTKDWFDPRYYQTLPRDTAESPTGPTNRPRSGMLVIKGASPDWAVSSREGLRFDTRLPYLGFRCVLSVEGPGNAFEPPPAAAPRTPTGGAGGTAVPF